MCKNPSDTQGQAVHLVHSQEGANLAPISPLPGSSREQRMCGPEGHTECQCNDSGVDRPRAIDGHLQRHRGHLSAVVQQHALSPSIQLHSGFIVVQHHCPERKLY